MSPTYPLPGQFPWGDDLNEALEDAETGVLAARDQAQAAAAQAVAAGATASQLGAEAAFRAMHVELARNLATNPSFESAGATTIVRENLATRPTAATAAAFVPSGAGTSATASRVTTGGEIVASFDRLTFPASAAPAGGTDMLAAVDANRPLIAAGDTVTASVYVRSSIAQQVRAQIQWLTSLTSGNAGQSSGPSVTLVPNTWTRISVTGVAPAGGAYARLDVDTGGTTIAWTEGATIDAQALLLERHGALLPYFDGSTPAGGDFTYSWAGTANASISRQNGLSVVGAPQTNCRAIQSSEWAASGAKSLRVIPVAVSGGAYVRLAESNSLQPGKTYTARVRIRVTAVSGIASGGNVRSLRYLASDNTQTHASAPDTVGVHELTITFTTPPAPVTSSLYLYPASALAGKPDAWFDGLQIVEGSSIGPYADGDALNWEWDGTPHASTSTARPIAEVAAELVLDELPQPAIGDLSAVPVDGVTDAQPALAAAFASGAKYFRLPAGATIALNNPLAIPSGVTIDAGNATLKVLRPLTTFAVTVASSVTIRGTLNVESPAGDTAGVELVGSNIDVGVIRVVVPDGQPQGGIIGDGAVLSRSFGGTKTGVTIRDALFGNVRVGRIEIVGFEFSAIIQRVQGIHVGELRVTRYRRGLFVEDSKHVWIDGGLISVASPWAAPDPGHNGVILEATAHDAVEDIHFGALVVRDAGEHGWRLGGAFRIRKVWWSGSSAINCGRGGFKVLGGEPAANNWHEDLWFDGVLAEDCGQVEINAGGIMLGYTKRVQISNPIIRRGGKDYSAGIGIHVIGSFDVLISNPLVMDAAFAAYQVDYTKGDQANITLVGGQLHSHGDAVKVDWTQRNLRRFTIEGYPVLSVTGSGVEMRLIEGGTLGGAVGTIYNGCHVTWTSTDAAAQQVAGNGAYRVQADVRAAFDAAAVLRDGSTWKDIHTGSIRIRKSGAWAAL